MNIESKFAMVIANDETIKFCDCVHKPAFLIKKLRSTLFLTIFLGCFCSLFAMGFSIPFFLEDVANPFSWFFDLDNKIFKLYLLIVVVIFLFSCLNIFIESSNTCFCVTNKRFIIRNGGFSTRFIDFELTDIFTVQVVTGMFDLQGEAASGDIHIVLRQYKSNSEGKLINTKVHISSVRRAYEAYRIMNENK